MLTVVFIKLAFRSANCSIEQKPKIGRLIHHVRHHKRECSTSARAQSHTIKDELNQCFISDFNSFDMFRVFRREK